MTRIYITPKGDCILEPDWQYMRRLASRRIETTTPVPAWMTPQLSPPVGGGEGNGATK